MKYNLDMSLKSSQYFAEIITFNQDLEKNFLSITFTIDFKESEIIDLHSLENLDFDDLVFLTQNETRYLFQRNNPNLLPRICFSKMEIKAYHAIISFLSQKFFFNGVLAFICEDVDKGLQNSKDMDMWRRVNRSLPKYLKKSLNIQKTINGNPWGAIENVDVESLPGHSHYLNYPDKLWFGSCWQMYYAPIYYKYIPKPLWDDFTDCFEHTVFDNGLRKIVLFENPEDFDLDESRAKQWSFRRRLGIDSIAHELTKSSNRVEPDYLPVLITKQDCKFGQTKVTRYLTKDHQLAMSEDLVEIMEVKEYLEDGVTVVDEFMVFW